MRWRTAFDVKDLLQQRSHTSLYVSFLGGPRFSYLQNGEAELGGLLGSLKHTAAGNLEKCAATNHLTLLLRVVLGIQEVFRNVSYCIYVWRKSLVVLFLNHGAHKQFWFLFKYFIVHTMRAVPLFNLRTNLFPGNLTIQQTVVLIRNDPHQAKSMVES